jgi:hypothetical protein
MSLPNPLRIRLQPPPLHLAIQKNDLKTCKFLIEEQKIEWDTIVLGWSNPITYARECKRWEIFLYLYNKRELNTYDKYRYTGAIYCQDIRFFKYLHYKGEASIHFEINHRIIPLETKKYIEKESFRKVMLILVSGLKYKRLVKNSVLQQIRDIDLFIHLFKMLIG